MAAVRSQARRPWLHHSGIAISGERVRVAPCRLDMPSCDRSVNKHSCPTPSEVRSIACRESDAASALETIGNLLKVEGSELEELKVHGQHISRNKGFFQRFRRLPGRLIRDGDSQRSTDGTNEDSVGQRSIATSWATFLLTDEGEGAAETSVASKAESPQE